MPIGRTPGPVRAVASFYCDQRVDLALPAFGSFASAYPIGLFNRGSTGSKRRREKAVGTREITVVSDFPNPWPNIRQEKQAIENEVWFPSTDDYIAVVKNSSGGKGAKVTEIVDSVEAFIYLILQQPEGSIRRINLLTHGAPSSIAFSGTIDQEGAVYFDNVMDVDTVRSLMTHGIMFRGKRLEWDAVDARFGDDAEIVFYACNSAVEESYLQDIANAFAIRVRGFSKELHYRHSWNQGSATFNRSDIRLEKKKDFHDLQPDVTKKFGLKDPF